MKAKSTKNTNGSVTIHTNFNIQDHKNLRDLVESVEGVEPNISASPFYVRCYSFLVCIGEMFDKEKVINEILSIIENLKTD